MRITEVSYSRLHSFGHYQNETIGAKATVDESESALDALLELRRWVDDQLDERGLREQAKDARFDLAELRRECADRREAIEIYRQAAVQLQQSLAELGASDSPAAKAIVAAFDRFESAIPREMPF